MFTSTVIDHFSGGKIERKLERGLPFKSEFVVKVRKSASQVFVLRLLPSFGAARSAQFSPGMPSRDITPGLICGRYVLIINAHCLPSLCRTNWEDPS